MGWGVEVDEPVCPVELVCPVGLDDEPPPPPHAARAAASAMDEMANAAVFAVLFILGPDVGARSGVRGLSRMARCYSLSV